MEKMDEKAMQTAESKAVRETVLTLCVFSVSDIATNDIEELF